MGRNNLRGTGLSFGARLLRWGMLVAFAACLFPIPMLPTSERIEDSENYPCKGSLCGCRTAQQCWTSCCCTTPEERLAWAIENNVTPPVYAVLSSIRSDSFGITQPLETDACHSTNRLPETEEADSPECEHCDRKSARIILIESETYCGNHETDSSETCSGVCSVERECLPAESSAQPNNSTKITSKEPKNKHQSVRFVRVLDALKCSGMAYSLDLVNQCVIPELNTVSTSVGPDESLIEVVHVPHKVYLAVSLPPPRS